MGNAVSLASRPGADGRVHGGVNKTELAVSLIGLGATIGFTYYLVNVLLKKLDPTNEGKQKAEERARTLMQSLGIEVDEDLSEYELCIAANLVDTRAIRTEWSDIGGLEHVINEINEVIILPFTRPQLFSTSTLLQPPKGVLLYGPPGCGKTMIAKATAKAAGARFINLQASSLFDKWYGESQKRAEAIFSLAERLSPTIIFIDEIDAFLRSRGSDDHESTAIIKAQFMSLWDGLATDHDCQVLIMGATNRPNDVDPAFRRRMPCMFRIGLPDTTGREEILSVILSKEKIDDKLNVIDTVARQTEGLSGSDLKELCRHAAVCRVRDYLRDEGAQDEEDGTPRLRDMNLQDFQRGLEKYRTTTYNSAAPVVHEMVD